MFGKFTWNCVWGDERNISLFKGKQNTGTLSSFIDIYGGEGEKGLSLTCLTSCIFSVFFHSSNMHIDLPGFGT